MAEARVRPADEIAGMLRSVNPATGKVVAECPACTPQEVREAVARARLAQPAWEALGVRGRADQIRHVRRRLHERMDDVIETLAAENRKPITEALTHDIFPTMMTLRYLERLAPRALRSRRAGALAGALVGVSSRIEWRPFGVVGVISPWNYPVLLSFMAITPALFAGNTVVLKPSEWTPGSGERIRELLEPLPEGVCMVVQGGPEAGNALVEAPCDKISFTGSTATGRLIAEAAGRTLTPLVLELGGQDSAIVREDADLEVASSGVLWGGMMNAGQTCAAIERVYVAESVAERFQELLVRKAGRIRPVQDMGPLTVERQLLTVERQVRDAVDRGATVLFGGGKGEGSAPDADLWFRPTLIEGRTSDMALYGEEVFGPIMAIVRVKDDQEAIRRTNEEGYNLTVSVWTRDAGKGREMGRHILAGSVTINDHSVTAATPWGPWGGVGLSGYGRLHGEQGLREFARPIHIAKNLLPRMKRPWWYPYDQSTQDTLRSVTELIAGAGAKKTLAAMVRLPRALARAVRGKL